MVSGGLLFAVNGPSGARITSCGFTMNGTSGDVVRRWCPFRGFTMPHDVAVSNNGTEVFP